jgi:hypothetical protein
MSPASLNALKRSCCSMYTNTGVPKGEVQTPPKVLSFAKAEPTAQFRGIYIRNNLIRIRVSFICKLSGTPD